MGCPPDSVNLAMGINTKIKLHILDLCHYKHTSMFKLSEN